MHDSVVFEPLASLLFKPNELLVIRVIPHAQLKVMLFFVGVVYVEV